MPAQIRVRCQRCSGDMLVDPHFLTVQTKCIFCSSDFLPASCVVPDPVVVPVTPSPSQPDFSFNEDEPPPRSSSNYQRHKLDNSFATGFGLGFGDAMGRSLAGLVGLVFFASVAVIVWYVYKFR